MRLALTLHPPHTHIPEPLSKSHPYPRSACSAPPGDTFFSGALLPLLPDVSAPPPWLFSAFLPRHLPQSVLYKVIYMLVLSLLLDHSQGLGPASLSIPPSA